MDIDGIAARQIIAKLADRLDERHRLDIADGAADLAQDEIIILIAFEHEVLDFIGDVRNHLNGGAEIVAAPLLVDDVL
jgi:translation initiation factor RLI1